MYRCYQHYAHQNQTRSYRLAPFSTRSVKMKPYIEFTPQRKFRLRLYATICNVACHLLQSPRITEVRVLEQHNYHHLYYN